MKQFLEPVRLSKNALARALRVPPRRINKIVLGKRAISADTDVLLARYFGLSEGFFLGLRADYVLMEQRREIAALPAAIALAPRSGSVSASPEISVIREDSSFRNGKTP